MNQYYSHGLSIHSEIELSELLIKKSSYPDVIIQFGNINDSNENFNNVDFSISTKMSVYSNKIILFWKNIPVFSISTNQIIINQNINLDDSFLRWLLLGHAFAILLFKLDRLVLHANALNINNGAILFLGSSGKGKSTISFAMQKKGYSLLSDDIITLEFTENDIPNAFPSFPRIKLWPDTIKNFDEEPDLNELIHLNTDKRSYSNVNNFCNEILPLKAIYLFKDSEKRASIKKLNNGKAIMEIIKSTYCFKLFNKQDRIKNLKQCSKIVNTTPIKIIERKKDFKDIPDIINLIEKDIII